MAGRVRRPSWRDPRLLIGLALIALAVAAVVMIVQGADTTSPFYAAARDLAPGTVVGDDDLVVVHVRVSSGEYVPQSDAVVGRVLNRTIGAGELIPVSALVSADGYNARGIAGAGIVRANWPRSSMKKWIASPSVIGCRSCCATCKAGPMRKSRSTCAARSGRSGAGSRGAASGSAIA